MRVLVVDDSQMTRMVAKNCLKNMGIDNVDEAEDGQQALKVLRNKDVDVVFSDWNMPNMSGLELLQAVRQEWPAMPFIMITTEGSKAKVLEAMKFGVSDYLAKPFTPAALNTKLQKWVGATVEA